MSPFFLRRDHGVFEPTASAAGPWSPELLHAGPPSALLARAIREHDPEAGLVLASAQVDVLGPVPMAPLTVEVEVVRPGRQVTLLQARALVDGRAALVVRGWLMARAPGTAPVAKDAGPAPVPADATPARIPGAHLEGYLSAVEWRFVEGGFAELGPASVWARPRVPLVDDDPDTGWDRTLVLADSGSGISLVALPHQVAAINCDLHVALHREPEGEWILLDSATRLAPGHGGVASTSISDEQGLVGTASQSLLVTDGQG